MVDLGALSRSSSLTFTVEELQLVGQWSTNLGKYKLRTEFDYDRGAIDELLLVFEENETEPLWMIHKTPRGAIAVRPWPGIAQVVELLDQALDLVHRDAQRGQNGRR